jgi:hypothetical protein
MANNKVRVVIPDNADEFIILIDDIIEKEESLAPDGTLSSVELNVLKAQRETAHKANKEKKRLEKLSEEETQKRDLAFGRAEGQGVDTPDTCEYFVTMLRDLLLAKNKQNPKVLGEWGFEVNDAGGGSDKTTPA